MVEWYHVNGIERQDVDVEQLLREKRIEILEIAARQGAHDVRIFGSVARGEASPDSDVDFLVNIESGRSLLDLGALWWLT